MKKAVVLLPTYNEKENLADLIQQIFAEEKNCPGWKLEVLIVDSGSPDGTLELAQQLAKKDRRIHTLKVGMGLGVALVEGHRYSVANLSPDGLVQLDADGQVGTDVIPRLLKVLDDGYTLAIGSRFVEGGANNLPLNRKITSWGSCLYCRLVMGPLDIGEFTNSARAFTPALFKRIDFKRIPWQEQTFIIQPAFLNGAIEAGATYKEVPLVFKNRAEGYSKNKTFNYTYDILTYGLDARLHKMGLKISFFKISRKLKTLFKFGLVGFTGTFIDFVIYKIMIAQFGLPPASSKAISTEVAILNNFILNNAWTFRSRKTHTNVWQRALIFNLVSLGGLAIAVLIVKFLHDSYGEGNINIWGIEMALNNFYFFATIPPVMIWNFSVNHFVTWRKKKD